MEFRRRFAARVGLMLQVRGGTMLLVFNRAFSDAVLVWLLFGLVAAFFAILTAPKHTASARRD